jgi:hypothetical protein
MGLLLVHYFLRGLLSMNSSGLMNLVVIDGQVHHLPDESTKQLKILLVEDENIVLKTMAMIFSKAGYETRGVVSAEVALALLGNEEWFLISQSLTCIFPA